MKLDWLAREVSILDNNKSKCLMMFNELSRNNLKSLEVLCSPGYFKLVKVNSLDVLNKFILSENILAGFSQIR
jgi:hypothetical protein